MTAGPSDEDIHERTLREEAELRFERFGLDDAWSLGVRMRDAAAAAGHPLAIGIRLGIHDVFRAAVPGASANNAAWVDRKIATVLHFERSSLGVGALYRLQGKDFRTDSGLDPSRYSAYGGGFPLWAGGIVVGAVAVSGLPQLDDHAFVVAQLRAVAASA